MALKYNHLERRNHTYYFSHTLFIYGKYQLNKWYFNALASYGYNEYTENKSPFGVAIKTDYTDKCVKKAICKRWLFYNYNYYLIFKNNFQYFC